MKKGRIGSPLVEVSPFVFNDKLYLLENNQKFWDVKGAKPGDLFHEDEVRIKDVATGKIVSVALKNHGFGTVLTHKGRVYIFAGSYGKGKPWRQITEITMVSSNDLRNWTDPITVIKAEDGEYIYNTAVCRGDESFVLLYETNDKRWPAFTFKYATSSDLVNWKLVPDGIYGRNKYVGGPALYYEEGWYYTLYLEALGSGYETRITRSNDLINWEDAPINRPFITFDPSHKNIPLLKSDVSENNASDVELCYFNGKTILYFTGSDQTTAGDLQWATYEGKPRSLFEYFFSDAESNKSTFVADSSYQWFRNKMDEMLPLLRSKMQNGVTVYSPGGYGGNIWSRDYYYIAIGASEVIPPDEIRSVVDLFLSKQLRDGRVPKNINTNLEADYVCWNLEGDPRTSNWKLIHGWQPEFNKANPNAMKPEADAAQFLVLLAAEYLDRSNDTAFVRSRLQLLHRAMQSIPRSTNGLVWIDPKAPHTSYGFTDGILKGGNELFCSLLFWQASGKMMQMSELAGFHRLQKYYRDQMKKIEKSISILWDEGKGAFLAATDICRQVDVWGTAFAVWIDFPLGNKFHRLLNFLSENFNLYVYKGQIRHLLAGEYWQASVSWPNNDPIEKDRFQNGAYWGTASGWVAYALAKQKPELATRLLNDLVRFYQQEGIYECVGPNNYRKIQNYGSSLTLPFLALKRLQSESPKPESDTRPPNHKGDWAPVLINPMHVASGTGLTPNGMSDVPTVQQLTFQERQLGAFIHFGPATYIQSDMMSVPAASVFNPTQLDAEQWVKTAKSFGAKHIVLTAKHHNGFCLWPTKTTDYSVRKLPWKNGKGDVVGEFVAACRKHDVKVGLYISGGINTMVVPALQIHLDNES